MNAVLQEIKFFYKTYFKRFINKSFLSAVSIFLVSTSSPKAQSLSDNNVLVKVGNLEISESEFIYRLEFTPKEGIQDKNSSEGIKKELLYTLIAEKLWANEAIEQGFGNHPSVIAARNSIEKMFLRDALYKKEIKDKINISPDEINKGLEKFHKQLVVAVFYSDYEKEIFEVHKLLSEGKSVKDVKEKSDTSKIIIKTAEVGFGDFPLHLENILYDLKQNSFTNVIQFDKGWNIFYLENTKTKHVKDNLQAHKDVVKILSNRIEENNYEKFYTEFFRDKKIDVDGKIFAALCDKIYIVFKDKKIIDNYENNVSKEKLFLDSKDVDQILEEFEDKETKQVFIKFDINPILLEKFLREISFTSFSVPVNNIDTIQVYLNKKTKEFIKYELLAREALNQGLNNENDVKEWTKIWYENFLSQMIKNNISDKEITEILEAEKLNEENNDGKFNPLFKDYINKTIELSEKYNFEIDENLLAKIKQGNINFFVMRNLGFGGSISGVPSSPSFIEWFLELDNRKDHTAKSAL